MKARPRIPEPCRLDEIGIVTALGVTPGENWQKLVSGDPSRLSPRDDLIPGTMRTFGGVHEDLPEISQSFAPYDCRNNRLALAALVSIREKVAAVIADVGAHRVGVVMGSSTAGVAEAEIAFRDLKSTGALPANFQLVQLEYGGLAEFIQEVSGAAGPCYALSTACSTGAKALAAARRLLSLGVCDAVVAGAADSLCQLTANGFHSLQAISKGVTNPMSCNRDGLILGEAAALFLVTRNPGGIQLLGIGESSDAHHISAPDPTGLGAATAMTSALLDAGLQSHEIAYLNLHGTGTLHNDAMESKAVARVFPGGIACSSTKPLVGHTLGASGAVEAAFCWLVLTHRQENTLSLPPHRFDGELDPDLGRMQLVGEGERITVSGQARLMSNSFGFGGSNCALVLGAGDDDAG